MNRKGNHRIAVAGSQWISGYLVRALAGEGFAPDLIINLDPAQAKDVSGYEDLAALAAEIGAKLYRPDNYGLKTPADEDRLGRERIDVLLVFGWQRLIPDWLIKQSRLGVYGVHGGPEQPPRCRGRAVFNWALILGYDRFYMYLFEITPGVDEGEILELSEMDINPWDDSLSLYHKNCVLSSRMFCRHLPRVLDGQVEKRKQPPGPPTFLPKRTPDNSGIDWSQPAARITNLVRAVAPPYPAAFSAMAGMRVDIVRAHTFDTKISYGARAPGEILDVFPNGDFVVQAGDHPIYVREHHCSDPPRIRVGAHFDRTSGVQVADPVV